MLSVMPGRGNPAPAATPILQGVRTGLLRSAGPLTTEGWTRAYSGLSYRPNTSFAGESFDPCQDVTVSRDEESPVEWVPWGLAVGSECFPASTDAAEEEARVLQRYSSQVSHMTEQVFWTGVLDNGGSFAAAGWPNRPLADPLSDDLTLTGPVGVVTAFNFAFEYLADSIGGLRGMLHVPYKILPYLAFYGVAIRESFTILTALGDHAVIAGTGYPGTAPDGSPAEGGTVWMYVTTPVRAAATAPAANVVLDRTNNEWEAVASGLALAEWDLQAHAAIQVCIPDPGPNCVAGVS